MTKQINAFCSFTLLATLLLWTIPCSRLAQAQSSDGLVMVANKLNTSTNAISKDQARRIMMEK